MSPSSIDDDEKLLFLQSKQRQIDSIAASDKLEAIQRRLLGYNAESAQQMTRKKLLKQIREWSQESGAVGRLYGDELYRRIVGVEICPHQNLLGCLGYFWKTIVDIIRDGEDREHSVWMISFPYCQEFYDYDFFVTFLMAIDMGRSLTMHLGSDFSLVASHPRYKHAPAIFSPERHSPFPIVGVHFAADPKTTTLNVNNNSIDSNGNQDKYPMSLDSQRRRLERWYQQPSTEEVCSSFGTITRVAGYNYYSSKQAITDLTKTWFDEAMLSSQSTCSPFRYSHTVESRWHVSQATIAEEAYSDAWEIIYQLNVLGSNSNLSTTTPITVSSVMITPNFSTFHASQWRNFAITINAALKRYTNGKMRLEVFHPEFASMSSASSNLARRSPFPTIQITYEG
jgi:hypothetical protein